MPNETMVPDHGANPVDPPGGHLHRLPMRTYRLRILGMGLAALPLMVVMHEIQAPWTSWAWTVLGCVVWPHLAYLLAMRSADPFRAELRNFVVDSLLAGSWVPLLHFNLLPSVLLVTMVTADKVNSGVRGLWLRSLPATALGLLAMGLLTGFAVDLQTSTPVLLACLPILVIHSLAVSISSYRLVRKVRRQNRQLEELSRIDVLTGLDSRGHWQDQAERALRRHRRHGDPVTLLLVDVDWSKTINDRHGHAVGDDVLRAIAGLVRHDSQPGGTAGRLGGDEFAVVLPGDPQAAERVAARLQASVQALRLPSVPDLRCSISVGLADARGEASLREWIVAADAALYCAKRAGRGRSAWRDAAGAAIEAPPAG